MSQFPQKRNINVAVANKRRHDLSHPHVGTIDFGYMKTIECRYLVPGDEINVNLLSEFRALRGMPSPTIGNMEVIFRSFFVPLHNVWTPFYDFLKNQPSVIDGVSVNVSTPPFILLGEFLDYFINTSEDPYVERVLNPTSVSEFDFLRLMPYQGETQTWAFKFTKRGRMLNSFLTSFGINIPYSTSYDSTGVNHHLYIILPLISFWKCYYDWVVPSRFIRQHQYYIELFISSLSNSGHVDGYKVSASDFFNYLCQIPYSYYLDDIFTSSTKNSYGSSEDNVDNIVINNPISQYNDRPYQSTDRVASVVNSAYDGQYRHDGAVVVPSYNSGGISSSTIAAFNMYTLQTLGKLQDMLNRNLIAGTKVQDWLLTEFGIKPNNDALHLSTYLGSKKYSLDVKTILSNADTESSGGVPLGSYGGYVNSQNKFDFGYKANEHGFYFITCELVPITQYYQGLQAQFDMGDRFDFFQPEFDNQQGMPIPFRRLYFDHKDSGQTFNFDKKFGFQLQYADMKYAPAVLSGDFRTRFGYELKSWFLARDVSYIEYAANSINGIDEEFCMVKSKYQDWHYIFNDTSDELDPFVCSFIFSEPCMRPMKSVVEGFEPTYQNGGKSVTLDFNGAVK